MKQKLRKLYRKLRRLARRPFIPFRAARVLRNQISPKTFGVCWAVSTGGIGEDGEFIRAWCTRNERRLVRLMNGKHPITGERKGRPTNLALVMASMIFACAVWILLALHDTRRPLLKEVTEGAKSERLLLPVNQSNGQSNNRPQPSPNRPRRRPRERRPIQRSSLLPDTASGSFPPE